MDEELEEEPQLDLPRHITNQEHYAGVTTIAFKELKGIIATDLPGYFPITLGQGNSYVLVMYDFDSNTINAVGIKNGKTASLVQGYNELCYMKTFKKQESIQYYIGWTMKPLRN